jgi:Putative auto-transporter adhesin, head GIN domain/Outer membrane protein beta-barrel domain
MKKNVLKTELAILMMLLFSMGVMAQNGNRNVVTQSRDLSTFNGLSVTGIFKVIFTQGEPQSVKIETDENLIDKINTEVNGGILTLSTKGSVNNPSKMNVYITAKDLKSLELSGASKFSTTNKINAPKLKVEISGIAAATVSADAAIVNCDISGVGKLDIEGSGDQITADISGTAKLIASKFEVKEAKVDASGVGTATVNATKSVSLDASGASNIKYLPHDNLEIKNKDVSGAARISKSGEVTSVNVNTHVDVNTDIKTEINTNGDSTHVRIGKLNLEVIDGPQTQVKLGRNKLIVDENGKVQFSKGKRVNSFHSHWSGFYIGVSGYLTPSGEIDPPVHDNFMSLDLVKSTNVQMNLFEQNMKITSNAGFVTGLGIDWRNYRFDHSNVVLNSASNFFDGTLMNDAKYIKSKLLVTYLTVPLLLELQTNRFTNRNSFHIAGGVSSGLRIGSHSKVKYENTNGGTQKNKDRSDFGLNPFKLDATALIGWGSLNFYGNYALIDMFKSGRGPELRPFSVGLRLVFD